MSKLKQIAASNVPQDTQQRRKALRGLLVSGGVVSGASVLPKSWTKPVIDSVILPSHAETTDDSGSASNVATTTPAPAPTEPPVVNYFWDGRSTAGAQLEQRDSGSKMFAERVLDAVIPNAHAVSPDYFVVRYICLSISGNTYTGRVVLYWPGLGTVTDYDGLNGTVGANQPLPMPTQYCSSTGVDTPGILVDAVTPASCMCTISNSSTSTGIPVSEGACGSPDLTCID